MRFLLELIDAALIESLRGTMTSNRRIVVILIAIAILLMGIGSPSIYRTWSNYRLKYLAEQCRDAQIHRRWDDLKVLADRWTQWDSQSGEAWLLRGYAANGRSEWSDAVNDFWRVPDSDSHAIPAMIEVSKLAFSQLNDPLKGVDACERIPRINPRAAGSHKQLIGFYATTLQREKLLRQIHAAIAAKCEPREAYVYFFLLHSLRSKSAAELCNHWLETSPNEESFLVARVLQIPDSLTESPDTPLPALTAVGSKAGTERSKLEQVNELLVRFPHNIELLAHKAELCMATGDVDTASALLSQAPESARQDGRFWRIKGWIHESNSEFDDANSAYRHALELHPVDWNAMHRLAVVERHRQNLTDVLRLTELVERASELRRVLRKIPDLETTTPAILIELAKLCKDCGERVIGSALEHRLGK